MFTKKKIQKIRTKKELTQALDHINQIVTITQGKYMLAKLTGKDQEEIAQIEANGVSAVGIKKALEWVLGEPGDFARLISGLNDIDKVPVRGYDEPDPDDIPIDNSNDGRVFNGDADRAHAFAIMGDSFEV